MSHEDRYQHEKDFWDKQISDIHRASPSKFILPNLSTFETLAEQIDYFLPIVDFWGDLRGKRVLDLACGDGWIALSLGKSGALVHGFDISPKRVEVATRYAKENGLEDRVSFQTMICEEMTYADNSFDFAIMHAALHHCDIGTTAAQIWRVLKPGGKAVLIEDYAYHPLMRLYRVLTPSKHTKHEKALSDEDLALFVSRFSKHFYRFYGLFNLVDTCKNSLAQRIRPALRATDRYLLKQCPFLCKYTKLVEIFVIK
jgi:SAM-dependent methyltransferase